MVALAGLGPVRKLEGELDRAAIDELGRGIAHAIHGAVSVVRCELAIIDGSVPPDSVHQVTLAVRSALLELNAKVAPPLAVREGSRWRKAIALGAACLPLVDRFFPEAPAGP
jgi:predicted NBD/HSP70 family sugar kinase